MARPYSLDLRERAVARVAAAESVRSVAAVLQVSVSSVVKWSQRFRATAIRAHMRRVTEVDSAFSRRARALIFGYYCFSHSWTSAHWSATRQCKGFWQGYAKSRPTETRLNV
jgi:hypothetical protein